MLKLLRFSCRQAYYEYRGLQWNMTILALIFSVMVLSSVEFITDKLKTGLERQSAQLLGGDLVVDSTIPIADQWEEYAKQLELKTARVVLLQTMISHRDKFMLVNLQAVSPSYPLYGNPLTLAKNTVLINQRIQSNFGLTLPASIKIGAASFVAQEFVPADLELSVAGWVLAPRVIISMADLAETKTLLPGSRVNYRLLIAGDRAKLISFYEYIKPFLTPQQQIRTPSQQRFQLLDNLNKVLQFIHLSVIISIILCGVAISLSVRQYVQRHHQQIALWRALGVTTGQIRFHYLLQLFLAAILAMILGLGIGYGVHLILIEYIKPFVSFMPTSSTLKPFIMGGSASFVILFCYAYPYIQRLSQVSALEIWRQNIIAPKYSTLITVVAFFVFVIFTLAVMNFSLFALFILDCLTFGMALFILISIGLFALLKWMAIFTGGVWYRGINQIIQNPESSSTQISTLALVLTCLWLLFFVKNDLLNQWQSTVQPEAPNYFAFNIAEDEVNAIQHYFAKSQPKPLHFYPMIRGRLIKLNQQPVFSIKSIDASHNALHRDLNLSASTVYPEDNRILEGRAFQDIDKAKPLISVESSLAKALHLQLGDMLTFLIDNKEIDAKVVNIREVNWSSMHPNFYVIFTPNSLPILPVTYITSFYLPAQNTGMIAPLLDEFPNITIIDMADILRQIQGWVLQASFALQVLFLFALSSALLVLIATLLTTSDQRRESYRLMRILGASHGYIVKSIAVEGFIVVTMILGLAYVIAKGIFMAMLQLISF